MPDRLSLSGLLLTLGLSGCARDAPTAAERPLQAAPDTVDLALAHQELSGLAVALEDAQSRILPTLGNGPAAEALGRALGELQGTLSQAKAAVPEGALERANAAAARRQVEASLLSNVEAPLGRAHAAAAELGAEAGRLPDVDVVLLVLERIETVARGPADAVPSAPCLAGGKPSAIGTACTDDAQPTAGERREP